MSAHRSATPGASGQGLSGADRSRPAPVRADLEVAAGSTGLSLLGEVLLLGAILAPAVFLIVTAVPGVAAGARHLRGHLEGRDVRLREVPGQILSATKGLWPLALGLPALAAVLGFNLWLAASGALPGGTVLAPVTIVLGAGALVVALRVAGRWQPGQAALPAVRAAGDRAVRDLPGSLLLVAALVLAVVLVWMLIALLLVVGGLLALAAVSVEHRATSTNGPEERVTSPGRP